VVIKATVISKFFSKEEKKNLNMWRGTIFIQKFR